MVVLGRVTVGREHPRVAWRHPQHEHRGVQKSQEWLRHDVKLLAAVGPLPRVSRPGEGAERSDQRASAGDRRAVASRPGGTARAAGSKADPGARPSPQLRHVHPFRRRAD